MTPPRPPLPSHRHPHACPLRPAVSHPSIILVTLCRTSGESPGEEGPSVQTCVCMRVHACARVYLSSSESCRWQQAGSSTAPGPRPPTASHARSACVHGRGQRGGKGLTRRAGALSCAGTGQSPANKNQTSCNSPAVLAPLPPGTHLCCFSQKVGAVCLRFLSCFLSLLEANRRRQVQRESLYFSPKSPGRQPSGVSASLCPVPTAPRHGPGSGNLPGHDPQAPWAGLREVRGAAGKGGGVITGHSRVQIGPSLAQMVFI